MGKRLQLVDAGDGNGGERVSWLLLDSYGGRYRQPVVVVGETETRYRIRALGRVRLGGRNRWLEPGGFALVPKAAIVLGVTG